MVPQEILIKLNNSKDTEDPNEQPEYRYFHLFICGKQVILIYSVCVCRFDEFGFRVEEEDGPEPTSNKLLSTPFIEDPQQRYLKQNSFSWAILIYV